MVCDIRHSSIARGTRQSGGVLPLLVGLVGGLCLAGFPGQVLDAGIRSERGVPGGRTPVESLAGIEGFQEPQQDRSQTQASASLFC